MYISDQCLHVYRTNVSEIQVSVLISYSVCHYYPPRSNHPMLLVYVLTSLMALFKSYPTISDITVPLALLCMWSHLLRCESSYVHLRVCVCLFTVPLHSFPSQMLDCC